MDFHQLMKWAIAHTKTDSQLKLYLYLRTHQDYPDIEIDTATIADDLVIHQRSVQRALNELDELGLIQWRVIRSRIFFCPQATPQSPSDTTVAKLEKAFQGNNSSDLATPQSPSDTTVTNEFSTEATLQSPSDTTVAKPRKRKTRLHRRYLATPQSLNDTTVAKTSNSDPSKISSDSATPQSLKPGCTTIEDDQERSITRNIFKDHLNHPHPANPENDAHQAESSESEKVAKAETAIDANTLTAIAGSSDDENVPGAPEFSGKKTDHIFPPCDWSKWTAKDLEEGKESEFFEWVKTKTNSLPQKPRSPRAAAQAWIRRSGETLYLDWLDTQRPVEERKHQGVEPGTAKAEVSRDEQFQGLCQRWNSFPSQRTQIAKSCEQLGFGCGEYGPYQL